LNMLDQMPTSAIFLIPARIEDCEPEDEQLEEIHWVDLFPEAQYAAGLALLLDVLIPDRPQSPEPKPANEPPPQPSAASPVIRLRSEPLPVSEDEDEKVFRLDNGRRPLEYIQNDFEDQGDVVVDHATGLMWQKAGSDRMLYKDAPAYIDTLNREQFAGYDDWRLPTIPELMSLLEPEKSSNRLYIDSIFDKTQRWCWSADRLSEGGSSS
ncbi:MAG: DUF1566 domain-containing protein, partial [Gammaproteobacteria bacterium]|nr:DUF1566 domain-containing protein [Gammaproteobacteria bacterium]